MSKAAKVQKSELDTPAKGRTTVYLRNDLYERLRYVCFKDKTSQTDVIADALVDYFTKWEKKNGEIPL